MNLDKRLSKLEAVTPDKNYLSYGELLEAERTNGTTENKDFLNLYNPDRYESTQ